MNVTGAVIGAEVFKQRVELLLIFVSEHAEGAGQAVFGCVPTGGGFALGSTGAGTQGGVDAIGSDLRGGGDVYLLNFIVSSRRQISG